MRYLSLFSGIEAVSVAWKQLGWECAAVSEILPFQSEVLKYHYPNVKNFGDVTKITEEDIKSLGKLDVVVFGSPCADMSLAGKRGGLNTIKDDENSSSILFFEGVRVFRMAQKYCGARYMVWENVPGALSSQEGRDFGTVLETLVGVRFNSNRRVWGNEGVCFGRDSMCEWSVLDAQWFGVAQRRRRLFVVLDTGDWKSRRPILLESESLRGSFAPSRKKGEEITKDIGRCSSESNFTFDRQRSDQYGEQPIASTISARDYKSFSDLVVTKSYGIPGNWINRKPENGGNSTAAMDELAPCLTATDHHAVATNLSVRRLTPEECETLQGFTRGYTNIKGSVFSKRINALGRSMAVPVMLYIGRQIENCER